MSQNQNPCTETANLVNPELMLSILHIEDDPLWGACVAKIIRETDWLRYLGLATTAETALELCRKHQPNIVLLDLRLPDGDGLEFARHCEKFSKRPRIIFLTVRADEATLYHLSHPLVSGMVWKSTFIRENLQKALSEAAAGRKFVSKEIRPALRSFRSDTNAFFKTLSDRELELLPLFGRGDTDEEIAKYMGIEPLTVKSHRSHIMGKLGLHKTEKLMRWCAEKGFSLNISPFVSVTPSLPAEPHVEALSADRQAS